MFGSSASSAKESRQRVIVKEKFQNDFIIQSILLTFIGLNSVIISGYLLIEWYGPFQNQAPIFALVVAVLELVGVYVVFYYSRRISFRVAGPIYAIEKRLSILSEGDLTMRIKLRKGDYFHEFGDRINDLVDTYERRMIKLKMIAHELGEGGERLSAERKKELMALLNSELAYFQCGEK